MNEKRVVITTCLIVGALLAGTMGFSFQQVQQRPPVPPAIYFPQQSAREPPAVVIRAQVTETTQVCAESDDGSIACRSVRDFRDWVKRESPRSLKKE